MSEILSAVGMLVTLILVLAAAYFCTKWIGKRSSFHGARSRNIKVIDTLVLGADRQVFIIQAAGKTMLIGVTSQHIEKICDIDANELSDEEPKQNQEFSSVFKGVLKTQWGIGSGNDKKGKDN